MCGSFACFPLPHVWASLLVDSVSVLGMVVDVLYVLVIWAFLCIMSISFLFFCVPFLCRMVYLFCLGTSFGYWSVLLLFGVLPLVFGGLLGCIRVLSDCKFGFGALKLLEHDLLVF